MAGALARGWGDPVLATDNGSGRAAALVAELGGEVARPTPTCSPRADVVVLAHKPYQLEAVAETDRARDRIVVSILGGTPVAELEAAYPDAPRDPRWSRTSPTAVRRGRDPVRGVRATRGAAVARDALRARRHGRRAARAR